MQQEYTPTEQNNEVEVAQTTPVDTSKIKIPNELMLKAVGSFAFSESRAQIADEILANLPDELKALESLSLLMLKDYCAAACGVQTQPVHVLPINISRSTTMHSNLHPLPYNHISEHS